MQPEIQKADEIQDRLAWHQPTVQRLTVSLDTRFEGGTVTDGESGSSGIIVIGA